MLSIFKDAQLKLAANQASPKRFLLPLKGGSAASALFMGDPYTCTVTATGAIGAAALSLDQTFELTTPGILVIGTQSILYTGKTSTSVTGIPAAGAGAITSTIASGALASPQLVYASTSTLRVDPLGIDSTPDLFVELKRSNQTAYNFPNTPALYTQTTINSGVSNAVELDVRVNSLAGAQQEFNNLILSGNSFVIGENLLEFSQQMSQSPWGTAGGGGVTATANASTAPDGTTTATQLSIGTAVASAGWKQTLLFPSDGLNSYYYVINLKGNSSTAIELGIHDDTGNAFLAGSVAILSGPGTVVPISGSRAQITGLSTTQWTQVLSTATLPAAAKTLSAYIYPDTTSLATVGHNMFVWGAVFSRQPNQPYIVTTTLPQPGSSGLVTLQAPVYIFRRDQALPQSLRLLPATRQVNASLPGFILGQYRWRDQDTVNATSIVPTQWDQDVVALGLEKFVSGMGHGDDLKPLGVIEQDDSIFMQINRGSYFNGPVRHYLPASKSLEFFPVTGTGPVTLTLADSPRPQTPVFVGTWKLDTQGYYENDIEYRYMASGLSSDPAAPAYQYAMARAARTVTINKPPPQQILFLGTISGQQTDYFDLPSYPVDRVDRVYIDRGLAGLPLDSSNWRFDRDQGTIQISNPASATAGPAISGALIGEAVFAQVQTSVAVEYETASAPTLTVSTVDINPTFSGLTRGYFYLQQRRQKADTIQLTVDKPVIAIPSTHDTLVGLTAYGPVYFDGDYAMLIARAFSKTPGETVPNARLKAILDPTTFTGLLNYRNPVAAITAAARASGVVTYTAGNTFQAGDTVTITALTDTTFNGVFTIASASSASFVVNMARPDASLAAQAGFAVIDITVISGGDGVASLIYIPQSGFGVWAPTSAAQTPITAVSLAGIKTTTLANDTLVLPTPIPISQLRNNKEGWLVTLYSILNNDPLFGLAGGNTALGQVPFATQGTPGSAAYKTNGERSPWTSGSAGSAPILPIHALDINGVDYTGGGFTGSVKQLQFGQALPTPTGLAAYFISFVQRITVQLQAIGTNVLSPPILLQMAVPDVIVQNPWLRLEDDAQGRINQFRLGWVKSTPLFGPTR